MKNFCLLFSVMAFFSLAAGAQDTVVFSGIVESVEARVNDDVITTGEVDEILQRMEMELGRPFRDAREYEKNRRIVLDKLIEEALLIQEARERGYRMDEDEKEKAVEREWQQRVQAQGGPEAMQKYLDQAGLTEEAVKANIAIEAERNYLRDRLLRAEITSGLHVTQEDIQDFKQKNTRLAGRVNQADISHILIAVDPDAPEQEVEAAREKALTLVNEIRAKGTQVFEEYAAEYSDHEPTRTRGGSLGRVSPGELFPEFDVVFELMPGEIAGPVRTNQGFHILKMNARPNMNQLVRQQMFTDALEEFIAKLRDDAIIQIKGGAPGEDL
jgi:peptidyl-prolyl cis-trans isomerase SurA